MRTLSAKIPPELYAKMKKEADKQGLKVQAIVRMALERWLEIQKAKAA